MRYFPIFLDSASQNYLLVGSGDKILYKLQLLVQTEAKIKVIANVFDTRIDELIYHTRGEIEYRVDDFKITNEDLLGVDLVYYGLDDVVLRDTLKDQCKRAHIFFNAIDNKDHCDFITPTIIDRDPINIAISTGGNATILAKSIKDRLELELEDDLGDFVKEIGKYRKLCLERLKQLGYSEIQRREYWQKILVDQRDDFYRLRGDDLKDALFKEILPQTSIKSKVYLIGTGPFDLSYLTQKAMKTIAKADVILIDRLINMDILKKWARKECEVIYVGKQAKCQHSTKQEEINQLLVQSCLNEDGTQNGKVVVRLKGGDPMIFGRASEELMALYEAHIDVEVIPGISAALAGASIYQIPITSRGVFRKFSILTAQSADGFVDHDWENLKNDALAIYMGSHVAETLEKRLLNAGFSTNTPICIVREISSPTERISCVPLHQLSKEVSILGKGAMIIYVNVQPLKAETQVEFQDERNVI
jgi:uroporphyrin-III C-methyltransferase/precorrin-2 dehydrogenase/sirohydrochlorin ferrochelatase